MPLPISSQTYIHNPLTGIQATQAGLQVGSPLSNLVEGIFSGFEKGTKIQQQLQQLELAPREQARKERATTLAEQKAEQQTILDQKKEDRLQNQMEFEQDYKTEELDIKRQDLKRKQDKTAAEVRRIRATTALASQKQAESNIVDGAINDLIIDGSVDSLDAALANENGRFRGKLLEKIIKDKDRGPAVAERIEDALKEGKTKPETTQRLQNFLQALEPSRSISTSREIAEAGAPILLSTIGARPRNDATVNMRKLKDGGFEVIEIPPGGGRVQLGIIPAETDAKTIQAIFPAIAAHNRMVKTQREVQKSISQVAKTQAEQKQLPDQQEQPTKISKTQRTAAQRTGLLDIPQTTTQTTTVSPEQRRRRMEARQRIQTLVNPKARQNAAQNKVTRSAIMRSAPLVGPALGAISDAID